MKTGYRISLYISNLLFQALLFAIGIPSIVFLPLLSGEAYIFIMVIMKAILPVMKNSHLLMLLNEFDRSESQDKSFKRSQHCCDVS